MAENKWYARYAKFDVRKSWVKLVGASLLLNVLILAGILTGAPRVSPASAWMISFDKAIYSIRPVTAGPELDALHIDASKLSKEQCMACHGTMVDSKVPLHKVHLTSELLPGLVCHDCHKKVSLEKRSNVKVVRMVDVGFCKKCHSAFGGLDPNSPMKPDDFKADCTTCHSGKSAYKHAQPYLSHVIAPRECAGCHGGRVLPWTPAHEKDDWVQTHGVETLRVGQASCMKCHEKGFAFCDDCHKRKPPSHEPRLQWLAEHTVRAKAETRACFTCHKAEFCKKCHINHTANWRETHFNFVVKNGSDGCMTCHSETFCSTCHISPKDADGTTPSVGTSKTP
jgi:hypothetical protein